MSHHSQRTAFHARRLQRNTLQARRTFTLSVKRHKNIRPRATSTTLPSVGGGATHHFAECRSRLFAVVERLWFRFLTRAIAHMYCRSPGIQSKLSPNSRKICTPAPNCKHDASERAPALDMFWTRGISTYAHARHFCCSCLFCFRAWKRRHVRARKLFSNLNLAGCFADHFRHLTTFAFAKCFGVDKVVRGCRVW